MTARYFATNLISFVTPLISSLLIGAYVSLLTNVMIRDSVDWFEGMKRLGLQNTILALWIVSLVVLLIDRTKQNKNISEKTRELIAEIFPIFCRSLEYPQGRRINMHYYSHRTVKGEHILVKERALSYESESMPQNYPLETIRVSEDNLVTSDAFKLRKIIYEELPPNHYTRYNERIKDHIDLNMRWILACPLWFSQTEKAPDGMIVLFGTKPFITRELAKSQIESLLVDFSKFVGKMLLLEIEFRWQKYQ
jgi:hypothetical protein